MYSTSLMNGKIKKADNREVLSGKTYLNKPLAVKRRSTGGDLIKFLEGQYFPTQSNT